MHVDKASLLEYLDRNPHIEAVSSHQIRHPLPAIPGFLFFDICFLRDPLDRIRSMYDYAREKPIEGEPLSEMALTMELRPFIERLLSDMPDWICEMQTEFLARQYTPRETQLERATQIMLQTSFIGVVDCFAKSIAAGEYFLRPVFSGFRCATTAVNVSKGLEGTLEQRKARLRNACGDRLFKELVKRNECDLQLVDRARVEVERRFRIASGPLSRPPAQEADRISSLRKNDVARPGR